MMLKSLARSRFTRFPAILSNSSLNSSLLHPIKVKLFSGKAETPKKNDQKWKIDQKYKEIPDQTLIIIAALGDQEAREENLIREIMRVDKVTWEGAQTVYQAIKNENRSGIFLTLLPYRIGIAAALIGGFGSFPLIFDLNAVMAFNEMFVTSDIPDAKDLETPLEVGSWAWNWMEPPLGQISFFLLCMQFARNQMENIGYEPPS